MKSKANFFTKNWTSFRGRATRKEYWIFFVLFWCLLFASIFSDAYLRLEGFLSTAILIVLLFVKLATTIRRLHDTNKSAWALLIPVIPVVGPILFFLCLCEKSHPKENTYGPYPFIPLSSGNPAYQKSKNEPD